MSAGTLEQRVAALEAELAQLKAKTEGTRPTDWLDKVWGAFANDPDFVEAMRLGREYRDCRIAITQTRLLSRNLRDFNRIPDLQVEDWTT
jgi:predicted nucleic acid-binding protein